MKTVYMITEGEYSDYEVVCVVFEKDLAEKLLERYNGPLPDSSWNDSYRLREINLIESLDEVIRETIFYVEVDHEGQEIHRSVWTNEPGTELDYINENGYGASAKSNRGFDEALKAARDYLAQKKAMEQGVT